MTAMRISRAAAATTTAADGSGGGSALHKFVYGTGPEAHAWAQAQGSPEDAALRAIRYFNRVDLVGAAARALEFAKRLAALADAAARSALFRRHEIISSSVLLFYDRVRPDVVGVKWIDFSHAVERAPPSGEECPAPRPDGVAAHPRSGQAARCEAVKKQTVFCIAIPSLLGAPFATPRRREGQAPQGRAVRSSV